MIDFSVYDTQVPHISGYKCSNCGTIYYPAPMVCKKCDKKRDPTTGRGWETFDLEGLSSPIKPKTPVTLVIRRADGTVDKAALIARIDTAIEGEYYRHGGILPYVLRQILK